MDRTWSLAVAARIGQRAGQLAATTGRPRSNPFTDPGLAEAWQQGYDRAVHPSAG